VYGGVVALGGACAGDADCDAHKGFMCLPVPNASDDGPAAEPEATLRCAQQRTFRFLPPVRRAPRPPARGTLALCSWHPCPLFVCTLALWSSAAPRRSPLVVSQREALSAPAQVPGLRYLFWIETMPAGAVAGCAPPLPAAPPTAPHTAAAPSYNHRSHSILHSPHAPPLSATPSYNHDPLLENTIRVLHFVIVTLHFVIVTLHFVIVTTPLPLYPAFASRPAAVSYNCFAGGAATFAPGARAANCSECAGAAALLAAGRAHPEGVAVPPPPPPPPPPLSY